MYDIEGKLMTENAESNTEEQELKCPKCGKKIIEDGPAYRCEDNYRHFWCKKIIRGHEITREEVWKVLNDKKSDEIEFISQNGIHYKGHLVLKETNDCIVFNKEPTGAKCQKCGSKIVDDGTNYKCENDGKHFLCWKEWKDGSGIKVSREELVKVFDGHGDELEAYKNGKLCKGRLVLNEAKNGLEFEPADRNIDDTGSEGPIIDPKPPVDKPNPDHSGNGDDSGPKGPIGEPVPPPITKPINPGEGKPFWTRIIDQLIIKYPFLSRHRIILIIFGAVLALAALVPLITNFIGLLGVFFPDLFNMNKSSIHSFEITLSNRKSAQKLEEFLDKNAGKIVELTIHYKQNLVYGWTPWTKYTEDSYYGDKYDSWGWDSAEPTYNVTYSSFGDNNRFYVRSFLYDKNRFEVEYRDFGGIGYCDFTTRYAYQLIIPYVKNNERMFEWQRDREKSREYIGAPSPYWVLKGTFIVNVKNGEELTDNITTLYDEFQKKKLKADYGKEYVVPEIAHILTVKPDCGDRKSNGDYSFSGKSFELEPLTQREHRQMDYN